MRKIRIFEHISLDGVIEHGEDYAYGAWTAPYRSPAGLAAVLEAYGTGFDLLLGRRTYVLWAGFWPKAGNSPMADALNAATKYVATHRPDSLGWGPVKNLGADIIEGVRGIKSKDGPDLIVSGSSTLTSVLLGQGLVDEVVLIVSPVLLAVELAYQSASRVIYEKAMAIRKKRGGTFGKALALVPKREPNPGRSVPR